MSDLQTHLDAMRALHGDQITTQQIVAYEAANDTGSLNVAAWAPRVSRGLYDLANADVSGVSKPAKPAKAVKAPKVKAAKEPKPVKVKAPKEPKPVKVKAPKEPKPVKAPKAVKTDNARFRNTYDDLISLRKDFEAAGVSTEKDEKFRFHNKFGAFDMVLGVMYHRTKDGQVEALRRKAAAAYFEKLLAA